MYYIIGQYDVTPENVKSGPRSWHLLFSAYDATSPSFPYQINATGDSDATVYANAAKFAE